MPRPRIPRRIGAPPLQTYFKPAGVPLAGLKEVFLSHDEVESLRLKDFLGMSQEDAAEKMGVSQPTFHRILSAARSKITDALINGKAIRISGGNSREEILEEKSGPRGVKRRNRRRRL